MFDMMKIGYKDPILVSGTDGVGTKLPGSTSAALDLHVQARDRLQLLAVVVDPLLLPEVRTREEDDLRAPAVEGEAVAPDPVPALDCLRLHGPLYMVRREV